MRKMKKNIALPKIPNFCSTPFQGLKKRPLRVFTFHNYTYFYEKLIYEKLDPQRPRN